MNSLNMNIDMSIEMIIGLVLAFVLATALLCLLLYKSKDVLSKITFITKYFSLEISYNEHLATDMEELKNNNFSEQFLLQEATEFNPNQTNHGFTPRNAVIETWKRLVNVLKKGNALYSKPITKFDAQQTLNLFISAGLITQLQAEDIITLHNLGKELNDNLDWTPDSDSAAYYEYFTDILVKWLENRIVPEIPTKKPSRKTTVDSFYKVPSTTSSIHPSAVLTGIKGNVKGKKFVIDKEVFYLGANAENDVAISDDDFVSSSHALLQTNSGALSLIDQHSRNGTFLNGKRLTDKPLSVNIGDKIQIGNSTFKVTAK